MRCENCQHYSSVNELEGHYRHNPPAIGVNGRGTWAVVLLDDRCGAYVENLEVVC